jgi:hypothetical protein
MWAPQLTNHINAVMCDDLTLASVGFQSILGAVDILTQISFVEII